MNPPPDDGLSAEGLRLLGFSLVAVALLGWGLTLRELEGGFGPTAGLWLAVGVVATVSASCCAVLVAVKRDEARLMAHLHHPVPEPRQ